MSAEKPSPGERERDKRAGRYPIVYCLIPQELAKELHDPLRRHFRDEPGVEVVVERRQFERRRLEDRRQTKLEPPGGRERRRIRASSGRRIADRRATLVAISESPQLPRRARPHAERITFVERLEPSAEQQADEDTARLVTRIQAGESELFSELYLRYFDRVYGYVRAALRDHHAAEDVTQQIFIQVIKALPRYERRQQPFRAWLFRIARNHLIGELRKRGKTEVVDPVELSEQQAHLDVQPETRLGSLDWISDRDLTLFVERLPLPQRQTLVLRFSLGLSITEIAAMLDRSEVDVRTLQHRALRRLEQRLRAIGRAPAHTDRSDRSAWRARVRQAPVIRRRRFALSKPRY